MSITSAGVTAQTRFPDLWTLIAVSALAYIVSVGLHEHAGHTAACVLLGGHPLEMGAFYANCDYRGMSALDVRLVSLAGPVVSVLFGFLCLALLSAVRAHTMIYLLWLMGTVSLMAGAGYPLFSGLSGLGDLGMESGGVFSGVTPEWLWRALLTAAGVVAYVAAVYFSLWRILPFLCGEGRSQLTALRHAAAVSYVAGAVTYVIIGAFNPEGLSILLLSVLPSSLGATSGLLWMFSVARPRGAGTGPGIAFERSWRYIAFSALVIVAYGVTFARSLRWPIH